MIEATTIYLEKLENGILIVKNVPCKKCSQCGEEFFSMAIMKEIEIGNWKIKQTGRKNYQWSYDYWLQQGGIKI